MKMGYMGQAVEEMAAALKDMDTSVLWHFHALASGSIILVHPDKKTRLCKNGRCARVLIHQMEVLSPLSDRREILSSDGSGRNIVPDLVALNKQAEGHGLTIDPDSRL
jgi:hypothetical protein